MGGTSQTASSTWQVTPAHMVTSCQQSLLGSMTHHAVVKISSSEEKTSLPSIAQVKQAIDRPGTRLHDVAHFEVQWLAP